MEQERVLHIIWCRAVYGHEKADAEAFGGEAGRFCWAGLISQWQKLDAVKKAAGEY